MSFVERGCDGIEKDVKRSAVLPEPAPQHLRDRKDELPVRHVIELFPDRRRDHVPVFLSAGRAEPGLACESDDVGVVAFGAFRDHESHVEPSALQRPLDAFDHSRPLQPCDVFLLEILPSCLEYVDDPVLASFPSGLRAVVEKPDQVCEGVASCMAGNVKTVAEKHFLVIGVLLEVRMRIISLFHINMVTCVYRKRLVPVKD